VNKARIASSGKTGLVLKISVVLLLLSGLLVYKLNDHFKSDKTYAMQNQVRKRVVSVKTSISGQLAQLKNVLSSYETELSESNVNWVQLDPFFAVARLDGQRVTQLVVRSNTPAERWNANYFEKALLVNKARTQDDIRVQLFKDRANAKFIILRFALGSGQELAVAGTADYFQKYFDIERGSRNKSLLVTTENILAAHTEADYIANSTKEAKLSKQKYIIEKEEIIGTNLVAISYVLKTRVVSGFAVPWSIVGVVLGFGFVLIGILFYNLDSIERRVERYRKQEREQIYKDTVRDSMQSLSLSGVATSEPVLAAPTVSESEEIGQITKTAPIFKLEKNEEEVTPVFTLTTDANQAGSIVLDEAEIDNSSLDAFAIKEEKPKEPDIYNLLEPAFKRPVRPSQNIRKEEPMLPEEEMTPVIPKADEDHYLTLDEEKIDLDEIEKALALDDFDADQPIGNAQAEALEKNLKSQKVSLSSSAAPIEKPHFVFEKKDFKVDEVKVNIRRPERS
jgi:hypothetical protein